MLPKFGRKIFPDDLVTLPQNLLTSPGTLYEDFEVIGDWTPAGTGGALSNDITNFKTGTQSLKFTTDAGTYLVARKTINWNMSNANRFTIWCYRYGVAADFDYIHIRVYNEVARTNGFQLYPTAIATSVNTPGWNRFDSAGAFWTQIGAGSWANPMVVLDIRIAAKSGRTAAASFDNLTWGAIHIPAIMFWFSDGQIKAYTDAFPILRAHNIRAVVCPITGSVGTGGFCTWAQLHELESAGWVVCNGTKDHPYLSALTEAQQEAEWTDAVADLVANNFTKYNYYAETPYAYTDLNADSFTAFTNVGIKTVFDGACEANQRATYIPPGPAQSGTVMETYDYTSGAASLANITTMIDNAIINKTFLLLEWEGAWDAGIFTSVAEYLATKKNQIYPITIDDYYNLTLGPVRVPRIR